MRLFTTFQYQAKSWSRPRRILCRVEVSNLGLNVRFVVTNLKYARPQQRYDLMYCGRGQMENFIKNHKTFLQSDRTSCHTFLANAFRLILHSAAYVLLHTFCEKALEGTRWSHVQYPSKSALERRRAGPYKPTTFDLERHPCAWWRLAKPLTSDKCAMSCHPAY